MTHIHLVKCPQCTRSFLWTPKKTFCSPKCRHEGFLYRKSVAEQSWADLPLADLPRQIDEELADLTDPLQLLVRSNAPSHAVGFRLGCFSSAARRGRFAAVRWFPFYPHRSPPVYWLRKWEQPWLPSPGEYLIAYFDAELGVISEPQCKVVVHSPRIDFAWSKGDAKLAISLKTGELAP